MHRLGCGFTCAFQCRTYAASGRSGTHPRQGCSQSEPANCVRLKLCDVVTNPWHGNRTAALKPSVPRQAGSARHWQPLAAIDGAVSSMAVLAGAAAAASLRSL